MVVYDVRYEPLELMWVVRRGGTPFSVHESLDDARTSAEEHARTETAADGHACRVIWSNKDGSNGGERDYAPR